jgi:hypothetical protein
MISEDRKPVRLAGVLAGQDPGETFAELFAAVAVEPPLATHAQIHTFSSPANRPDDTLDHAFVPQVCSPHWVHDLGPVYSAQIVRTPPSFSMSVLS